MRLLVIVFCALACLVMNTATARAQTPPKDLVKADLLANYVVGESSFWVGVRLKIEPEWHVYWKNPGDSGLPIQVKWRLPEGFSVSDLQFPTPIKFVQPGDIVGYGYKDEVMLVAKVSKQEGVQLPPTVTLGADVKWLVCNDICVPGKASVSIELKADQPVTSANDEFAKWAARLPVPANAVGVSIKDMTTHGDVISFAVDFGKPVSHVEFFPPRIDQTKPGEVKVTENDNRAEVSFSARSLDRNKQTDFNNSQGVVAYVDDKGVRHGIIVPLGSTAKPQ